ncbi:MAG: hypothetical protein IJ446_03365 [Oscillospiraceae bacterium]|nr:hypothetical protein [Oscillospiraceae bacterium]
MYFGSVKFFKQLIYSTVIDSVVLTALLALIFGIKSAVPAENIPVDLPLDTENSDPVTPGSEDKNGSDGQENGEDSSETTAESTDTSVTEAPVSETDTVTEVPDADMITIPKDATIEDVYDILSENGYTEEQIVSCISDNGDGYLNDYILDAAEQIAKEEKIKSDAPLFDSPVSVDKYPGLYGAASINIEAPDNTVYLVIDESPSNHTKDFLTILDNTDTKAVFLADTDDDLSASQLERIISEGHSVGISVRGGYDSTDDCLEAVNNAFECIRNMTGTKPAVIYCREDISDEAADELERRGFIVSTDVICGDNVKDYSWSGIYNNSVKAVDENKGPSTLKLMGGNDNAATVMTAEDIINRLKEKGYSFSLMGENVSAD